MKHKRYSVKHLSVLGKLMGVQCCPDLNLFLILCHTGLEYDEGELITGFSLLGELSIEVFYTL